MTSRDAILHAVRRNRPTATPLPEPLAASSPADDLVERFRRVVREIRGSVVEVGDGSVAEAIRSCHPDAVRIASTAPHHLEGNVALEQILDPHDLADLDLLVCEGEFGVAETGAIWLPESALGHRAAPFITQHLVVVLPARALVADQGEAYARVDVRQEGYAVFIAGPSKTADIEQSLVIGAHGPRSLTVVLV